MIVLDAAPIDVNAAERSLSSNSSPAAAVGQSGGSALLAMQHCQEGFAQRGKVNPAIKIKLFLSPRSPEKIDV